MIDHKLRANGIGSSEIAALVGLSPWAGPHDIWLRKLGLVADEDSAALERGRFYERGTLDWYAHRTGSKYRTPGTMQHQRLPYVVDSVDAIAERADGERCVEAKTTGAFQNFDWGDEGTDQIPDYYLTQCIWHMGVWGLGLCDVPVFDGRNLRIYTVQYDAELFGALAEQAARFWRDFVETKKEPPVDGRASTSEWIKARFRQKNETLIQADAALIEAMRSYKTKRNSYEILGDEVEALTNALKVAIGEASGIEVPGSKIKITWKQQNGRQYIDWQAIARHLAEIAGLPPERLETLQKEFTKQGEPFRTFHAYSLIKAKEF